MRPRFSALFLIFFIRFGLFFILVVFLIVIIELGILGILELFEGQGLAGEPVNGTRDELFFDVFA